MSRPKEINPNALYQRPRHAAYISGRSLWSIREGLKAGTIPHIRVGRDYLVNMRLWTEQMERESRESVGA